MIDGRRASSCCVSASEAGGGRLNLGCALFGSRFSDPAVLHEGVTQRQSSRSRLEVGEMLKAQTRRRELKFSNDEHKLKGREAAPTDRRIEHAL